MTQTSRIASASPTAAMELDGADGLTPPRRRWAALAIWVTLVLSVLDVTIVNVALPNIGDHLGVTPDSAVWVVTGYQIAIVMLLFPMATLGEKFGFRRVYLGGVAVFAAASLGCTLASGLFDLVCFRFMQGVGAAAIMALNGALVRLTFPRATLGRAIGYNALVIAVSSAAGPSVAAAVLSLASWRWLFAVNVPIAAGALLLGLRFLPTSRPDRGALPVGKSLLTALVFGAFFLSAADFGHGATPDRWVPEATITALGMVLLWFLTRADENPVLPIDLMRIRVLRLSYLTSVCSFAAQMIVFVTLPFFLLGRSGMNHLAIGAMMTAWPLATAVAAPLSGRLIERWPGSMLGGLGLSATAAAMALLAVLPASAGLLPIAVAMALGGAGFGLFQTPNNRTLILAAPAERSGAAASMQGMARLVGQTAGAIAVAILFRTYSSASAAPLWLAAALSLGGAVTSQLRRAEGD